ncbi:MAG TPA: ShlB/FhaC/HecB family hemolysin secretion/activation protein [Desulfobacterales bacterium]|nr:ShlB/FhaC/HecB family hemolysin secretion/activation protein [Desulfobacterales bacterium]
MLPQNVARPFWRIMVFILGVVAVEMAGVNAYGQPPDEVVTFEIAGFVVEGNTLLPMDDIEKVLLPYTGPQKTAEDVERARNALENIYHEAGFPTVLVNIPEQTVEEGVVELGVIESQIRKVRVVGNRYFTKESILGDLPSFRPGEILYIPKVEEELNKVNRNTDLEIFPLLSPGKELGTIDVELKVKDHLPVHGSLELNNRSTWDTTDLRLNAMVSYDNLWQREHSISAQYQTSPEDTEEVQAVAGSYVLPTPWNDEHILVLYGIWSDSDTAFGTGFQVIGKGKIFGTRYVLPLPPNESYAHNLTVGLDYKDFDEDLSFETEEALATPITYLPLSFSYSGSVPDGWGLSQFSAGLNMAFRGLVTDSREFEDKRYGARGNYLYATVGVERIQTIPAGMSLLVGVDGQVASQPLISNEQYTAGGIDSVRGYKENEEIGDDAIHGTAELSAPNLLGYLGLNDAFNLTPYVFYDAAALRIKEALPDQDDSTTIQGTGGGIRGFLFRFLEYEVDWAMALRDTDRTEAGDTRVHFKVKFQF